MGRLVLGGIISSFIIIGSVSLVGGQADPLAPPTEVRTTPGTLTNIIDGIDVPWEILEYVQMKYEGHAVTKADKIRRGNSELYRLRVDRDDVATDYDSIAVLFDMKWKLVGEEKYATPPPKPVAKPDPPKEQKPAEQHQTDQPEIKPDEVETDEESESNEGGRGAGDETPEEQPARRTRDND